MNPLFFPSSGPRVWEQGGGDHRADTFAPGGMPPWLYILGHSGGQLLLRVLKQPEQLGGWAGLAGKRRLYGDCLRALSSGSSHVTATTLRTHDRRQKDNENVGVEGNRRAVLQNR